MSKKEEGVDLEEEYFHREDEAKIAKLKAQRDAEKAAEEARQLKELHHHRCGKCGTAMDTQIFRGVEIEVCGACGAVLLDPGELETLAGKDGATIVGTISDLFRFSRKA